MRNPEKIRQEMEARNTKILDTAFQLFLKSKIEGTSMEEIAKAAEIGRVTLYRYYSSKGEIAIALWKREWAKILDEIDIDRPLETIETIPAIDRLRFTLDLYIETYQKHKEIFQLNENINNYIAHENDITEDKISEFMAAMYSADTRFSLMYEKAKQDKTFRTDIPKEEFFRVTVGTIQSSCVHYADDFEWGRKENRDYTPELMIIEEMILDFVQKGLD